MLSPIVLFVYNRPVHTQKTIESLKKNVLANKSVLYVFSDAAKNDKVNQDVAAVRELINNIEGFKDVVIVEQKQNLGLASSVIGGVSKVFETHEKIIVLEDDLLTSPYFLTYMNKGLDFYENSNEIYSITGFNFSKEFMGYPDLFHDDVYLNIRPMSWSWATWKKDWVGVDWDVNGFEDFNSSKDMVRKFNLGGTDLTNMLRLQMKGQLDSWYIRWTYNAFLKQQLTIYPTTSFVNNIGHDSTGVHCQIDKKGIFSHDELSDNSKVAFVKDIKVNQAIVNNFNKAFNMPFKSRLKQSLKRVLS